MIYFPGLARRLRHALRKPMVFPPRPGVPVTVTLTDQPDRPMRLTTPLMPNLVVPCMTEMSCVVVNADEAVDFAPARVSTKLYRLVSAQYEPCT